MYNSVMRTSRGNTVLSDEDRQEGSAEHMRQRQNMALQAGSLEKNWARMCGQGVKCASLDLQQ